MWIVGERTGTGLWARKTPAATKNKPRLIRHGALGQSAVADGVRETALWAQPRATAASGSRRAAGRRAKLGELAEGKSKAVRIKPALLGGAPGAPSPRFWGWLVSRCSRDGGIWGMEGFGGCSAEQELVGMCLIPARLSALARRCGAWRSNAGRGLRATFRGGSKRSESIRIFIFFSHHFFPFKPFFYTVRKENDISGGFFPLQLWAANASPLFRLPDRKGKTAPNLHLQREAVVNISLLNWKNLVGCFHFHPHFHIK